MVGKQVLKFSARFGFPKDSLSAPENEYAFIAPWQAVHPEHVNGLIMELQRELPQGHVLNGLVAVPIGHHVRRDDVLYRLGDPPFRFAAVHLTFTVESDPYWPSTRIYDSFERFATEEMNVDA